MRTSGVQAGGAVFKKLPVLKSGLFSEGFLNHICGKGFELKKN
jgi:hypothetical protein